ncbi:MAG: heme-copper oxidase subunit III [Chloroflexi bacterium]|nr:heme-copper oxidase subunit III [Chloroflexota bacterium]
MIHAPTTLEANPSTIPGLSTRKFAMWLFLASEVMFFTGLIGAYLAMRFGGTEWPIVAEELNVPLVAANTFILIVSSVTMVKAFAAIENGDTRGLSRFLLATMLLGIVFVSIQGYEWSALLTEGTSPSTSVFGATFFTLTGFHGLHVLGGVVTLLFVTVGSLRGRYTLENHSGVELMGLYWHFVDIVWIFLFTIVYLI